MICPWCDRDYPVEFFETHHKNHVHNDDRPENRISICVKCHQRHHRESGYDTIIIKKDEYNPKTLEELMADITREEFLKAFRIHQSNVFEKYFAGNKDEWKESVIPGSH